jgi:glycosyltransferase involved in cell wall biosynthesis
MVKNLISIIIPTYNRGHLINKTLDSIIAQTYTIWECIIVDDGSTDNTDEVVDEYLKKDKRFQYHHRSKDRLPGGNAARNYGFEISNGYYVNWFDSDDLMHKKHLEYHVNNLLRTNADVSVSKAIIFENKVSNLLGPWSNIDNTDDIIYDMISLNVLWQTGSVFWKRKSILKNHFIEELRSSQEWTFHLQVLLHNKINFSILNEVTNLVRSHEDRIGKMISVHKIYSTFKSRLIILKEVYKNKSEYSKKYEYELLKQIFKSFKNSIEHKFYKNLFKMMKECLNGIDMRWNYKILFKIYFISVPFYILFRKGEKLFKI